MTRCGNLIQIGVGLVAITLAVGASYAAEQEDTGEKLMQLERDWCTAAVKNDAALLDSVLADDVVDISPSGKIFTKAQDLVDIKTDKTSICQVEDMNVRIFGDSAVVVGRMKRKTSDFDGQIRFADTYVRRGGRW